MLRRNKIRGDNIIMLMLFFIIITAIFLLKFKTPQKEENIVWENGSLSKEEYKDNYIDKIELVEGKFNVSKIKSYEGETKNKFEFRPKNFEQFIGQKSAKEQAKTILKKVRRGMKGHLFISARPGTGKTTYIKILANELNAKLITRVGKQVNHPDDLVEIVNEINSSEEKNTILFLDEMDSMDKKLIKMLNPIIEEFEISGKKIKPFIFAGASINKDTLLKNNPDTLDRIPHHIHFESYNDEDIKNILSQYKTQLYPDDNLKENDIEVISKSSKYCPRIAIGLLEDLIVEKDIKKVLQNRRISKDGLTEIDIKILNVLKNQKRAMGANALAQRVGISQNQYVQEFEPFLCEFEYISRIPSRIITDKGLTVIKNNRR